MTSVLITRPYKLAINSQIKIKALGINSIIIPMIKIRYCNVKIYNDDYKYIILTSQNAVQSIDINPWIRKKTIIVVGNKTKENLLEKNCTDILFCQHNARLLIKLIEKRIDRFSKILYLCGNHLAYDLVQTLAEKKYKIFSRIVYQSLALMSLVDIQIYKIYKLINIILFYSPRTAEIFAHLCQKYHLPMKHKIAICISARCATKILDLNWKEIKIASQSNEDNMLNLLSL